MPERNSASDHSNASAVARGPDAQQQQAADALKSAQPSAVVNWDPSVGTPSQVSAASLGVQTLSGVKGARSKAVNQGTFAQRAIAVMDNLAPLFRIKEATSDFEAPKLEETDRLGFRHQRLAQVHRGLPVVGGDLTVHFDSLGAPYRVDGRYVPDVSVDVSPAITAQAAVDAAQKDFAARGFVSPTVRVLEQPELVVYTLGASPVLAYQLVLQDKPANARRYWINAATGGVVASQNRVCHIAPPTSSGGIAAPLSGNVLAGEGGGVRTFGGWSENAVYYMYSPTNFYFVHNNAGSTSNAPPAPSITADRISAAGISAAPVYPDANTYAHRATASWGVSDSVEVSIAANMESTFGYYKGVHGRDGYDAAGTVVAAVAHYHVDYVNAFWDGTAMYFGDGDGVLANSLAVIDVCAHELTHAVTETTANLDYSDESGALNESFSDIFGALVEFRSQPDGRGSYPSASPGTADWLCGEDCWLDGTALRDLRNPSSTETLASGYQQPSKYKGAYWQDYTTDPSDNGGVHNNSGVQNFFFYLLCEGGNGNNGGIAYDFAGISIENAAKVAYRTLTVYCTANTDFKEVQNLWMTAAQDLNPAWVPAVRAAWRAVGIGITSPLLVKTRAKFPMTPYRITATDAPSSFSATGLPAGLSLNATTGVISGTPTAVGEFDASVSATSGGVTFTDTLHLSILDPSAPVVRIESPFSGAKYPPGRPFKVLATATDLNESLQPGTVARVELFVDGASVGTDTAAPYEFTYTPSAIGNPVLTAIATDTDAKTGVSAPVNLVIGYLLPGEVDLAFTPPAANNFVRALAADSASRLYIGGDFTTLSTTNTTNAAVRVARLQPSGAIDADFNLNYAPDAAVRAMAYVPPRPSNGPVPLMSLPAGDVDHGLYVAGDFSLLLPQVIPLIYPPRALPPIPFRALARVSIGKPGVPDGTLDATFDAQIEGANAQSPPNVRALAVQSDGRLLVGGFFARVGGASRSNLARLNPDGSLDSSFNPTPNGAVHAIALQPDGKILIGGAFSSVNGSERRSIARLNADGSLDSTFVVGTGPTGGFNGPVHTIAVTLDGEIAVGGQFTSFNGRSFYNNLAKLTSTGAVSPKFNFTPGLNNVVNDLHLRADGSLLVSGQFTQAGNNVLGVPSTPAGRILQMFPNGALDPEFNVDGTGADGSVLDSITLPNGDILLAGGFTSFNGIPRGSLAVIAGFEGSKPIVTSAGFHTVKVGDDLNFGFTASAPGAAFARTGALPRGVKFSSGRLTGIPLDAGRFEIEVTATTLQGSSDPTRFVLQVNDGLASFQRWSQAWFGHTNAVPAAVLNGRGLSNLLVYALTGGDSRLFDPAALPVPRRELFSGKTYLTLTVPKYPGASVTRWVEYSTDLRTWKSDPASVVVLSDTATELKVRAAVPTSAARSQYLRLKVRQ